MPGIVDLSEVQQALEFVEGALSFEADAKQLKKDLGAQLREAVTPILPIIRGELMAMGGDLVAQPPLRATVGSKLTIRTRYSGPAPGVRVAIGRKGMPRGFDDAARKINQGAWLHPLWGRPGSAITQTGAADFFDRPLQSRQGEMRDAVEQALQAMALRIASRAGG